MNFTNRAFANLNDLGLMTAFLTQARAFAGHDQGFLHAGDVWWRYGRNGPEAHRIQLWFATEKLVGLGWIFQDSELEVQIDLRLETSEYETLASEILTWARGMCEGEIETSAASANTRAAMALERHGFVRDDFKALVYARDLREPITEPIIAPNVPDGFQVRHVHEHEFAERVAVHRDAWDSTKMTIEDYVRVRSMRGFRADLDLVVATPEQGFAAYCSVWLAGGIGQFEPVGTRAAHRRQGLGQAVILEGFRRLQAFGAHTAIVHSQPDNRAFYESCGFRVVSHEHGFVHRG